MNHAHDSRTGMDDNEQIAHALLRHDIESIVHLSMTLLNDQLQ